MSVEPYWAVAVAQTCREELVVRLLKRDGFETYVPRIRSGRRVVALFPGYIIVRIIVRWYPVRWCPGVQRLLMSGDKPARLPDDKVDEIMRREIDGIVKLPKPPSTELTPGALVRITVGTFAGHFAIYQGQSTHERERVLLDWLGQSVPAILPARSIVPVEMR